MSGSQGTLSTAWSGWAPTSSPSPKDAWPLQPPKQRRLLAIWGCPCDEEPSPRWVAARLARAEAAAGGPLPHLAGAPVPPFLHERLGRLLTAEAATEVYLQKYVDGAELLLGSRIDPHFGLVLAFGNGGRWAEWMSAARILIPPITAEEIRDALPRQLLARLAEGTETAPQDLWGLVDLVLRVEAIAIGLAQEERTIELNPIIATPRGPWIVDAWIT